MSAIPTFPQIRAILDALVDGRWEFLKDIHGPTFEWTTKPQLQAAVVRPGGSQEYRLIDPELARQGRGRETNLIQALVKGVGGFSRMPKDGPYAKPEQIDAIVAWINGGMPD
ncbi:MAG TPA: cytochrome c [Thermoanaerobaculia bacterium]|jgi:hypothetical protein